MRTSVKNISRNLPKWIGFLLIGISTFSCASSTRIIGSWKSPEATAQTFNKVVVAALTDNVLARQKVENDLQAQLLQRGISATKSIDIFPPTRSSTDDGPDVDLLLERIKGEGHDAILTVTLVDEETETRYVPGTYGYQPMTRFGWYGRFSGYYNHWYPLLYDPGYYTEDKVYYLESNLYDTDTEKLLWSAQSRSYSPSSLRRASETLAEIIVNKMVHDNLIRPQLSQR